MTFDFVTELYLTFWKLSVQQLKSIQTTFIQTMMTILGSGCGAVGRAVTYDTRGPGFESSHRQLLFEHLFTVNCL